MSIARIRRLLSPCFPTSPACLPWKTGEGLAPKQAGTALVLHAGALPTVYYYFLARRPQATIIDTRRMDPSRKVLRQAREIIIVRHAALNWMRFLREHYDNTCRFSYFLDDDLPDRLSAPYLPAKYACKTWKKFHGLYLFLQGLPFRTFVATLALAAKYRLPPESVLPPLPPEEASKGTGSSTHASPCVIFYHGTASHRREIHWLREVAGEILDAFPQCLFEISGTARIKQIYSGMERVRVLHPMPWPPHLAYTRLARLDIGLAPLLDSPFNLSRSHVKFFDITRAGAAGVYSDSPVFRQRVRHGHNGLLVDGTGKAAWVAAIQRLVADPQLRCALQHHAEATIQTLREELV